MTTTDSFNWDVDTWVTLDSYFAQNKVLTENQLESFNDFVDFVIPQIIERNNPIIIGTDYDESLKDFKKKYVIEFLQTYLSKPLIQENNDVIKPLMPNEARLRGLTYSAPMFVDVKHTLILKDAQGRDISQPDTPMSAVETKIPFFKLPVMLHSKYCHLSDHNEISLGEMGECEYDQGGYFIVNGGEKVLVAQERIAENHVFVWSPSKNYTNKYSHEAEIKSSIDQRFHPVKTNKVKLTKEPSAKSIRDSLPKGEVVGRTFRVQMPNMKDDIPLFIMFRALGIVTEKEIFEIILSNIESVGVNYTNLLIASVEEARAKGVMTQDSALHYISRLLNLTFNKDYMDQDKDVKLKYVKDVLNRELLPHIGQNNRKKAFFLGYMTRRLMDCYHGVRPYDDRDHYGNKRVDLAGPLLTQLFGTNFLKLVKDIRQQILPKLSTGSNGLNSSLRKIIQSCNIESKIKYGLATGNWSNQKTAGSSSKRGIAQVLNRLSFIGALSHTRRVQSPLEMAGSKIIPPRRLHATHFGMCCPNETPEGAQVGIVKNFSMQTLVTIQTSDYPIRIAIKKLNAKDIIGISPQEVYFSTKIFINGDWVGIIPDKSAKKFYEDLKYLKRMGIIVPYISISWFIDWKEIQIQTDGGRYSRPLYVVKKGSLLIEEQFAKNESFREKFRSGSIKWRDFLYGFHEAIGKEDDGGVVEYLDTNEMETSMVAMTVSDLLGNKETNQCYMHYTHCEIHPMMMMGVVSTMIPFSDHNQSPRNCYQCLWKEEEVIMSDGSRKKIKDIEVGNMVITVDPKTLEQKPSKVINQYIKPTNKKIILVGTISGRKVVCTDDHPILTNSGWKKAGSLTNNDLICVCPTPTFYLSNKNDLIIDENQFISIMNEKGLKDSLIKEHLHELSELGLLPLNQNSKSAPILARIVGFCMTNGSICIGDQKPEMSLKFSLYESGEEYLNDVETLGFNKNPLTVVETNVNGSIHREWEVIYDNAFVSLIISLGKLNWIKNGSQLVKREFLAGFYSGDCCEIRYTNLENPKSSGFIINSTTTYKCPKHSDFVKPNLICVKELFGEFNIICKDINVLESNENLDMYQVEITFESSINNVINHFENIGYRYDLHKYRNGLIINEYFKYHQTQSFKTNNLKKELSFDEWIDNVYISNKSIFVPIDEILEHHNVEIADITISSETHSFITGNQICVHNSSMGKQAIGYYVTNYNSRMDTMAHVLVYGHKPLVATRTMKYTLMDKLPHGNQAMLLYACYTGYNQEDSVILNGDAVERGFFNTIFFRTYNDKEQRHKSTTTASEKFAKPDKNNTRDIKHGSYDAINEDGIPLVGKVVSGGDVIIGKIIESKEQDPSGFIYKDVSTTVRYNEHGTIDKVIPDDSKEIHPYNAEGHKLIKVRVSILRHPEIGDKFASRHAQKGTCGMLYKTIDMPFNCYGMVPDVIMNPHGIPSRMTAGKLIETLLGKVAVSKCQVQDATPFTSFNLDNYREILKNYGLHELGNEVMYNGQTGQMFDVLFFYGPTYYQRLKHMVDDKIHCLTMDHEVLTSNGWKYYHQLTMVDEIATLKNNKLVYEKPMKLLYYPDHIGNLYQIKNQQVDLLVTSKHRMWVSLPYVEGKNWEPYRLIDTTSIIGKHVKYQKNADWEATDYQFVLPRIIDGDNFNHQDKIMDMDAWITFFGVWIAKGWTTYYKTPESNDTYSCIIQICQCGTRIENAIKKLGYNYSNSNGKITINDTQLFAYLDPLSLGAQNKYLPDWVWELSKPQCQLLIDNMILVGDNFYTSSIKLGDDFMRLCLHAGWSANKTLHSKAGQNAFIEGRTMISGFDVWELMVVKNENNPSVNNTNQDNQTIQIEEIIENIRQPVFCLQVPSEVFYVRRNGKPVWTGNSRETGPLQLLTRQPAEGRSRDGGLRLGEMERDCLIAHGIPKFMKERMMDSSDLFRAFVSKKEETLIVGNPDKRIFKFNGQNIKDDEVMEIQLPYAMKLLLQEVESMGIDVRIQVV